MAARLRSALEHLVANGSLSGLGFAQDSPTNAVFARLPVHIADRIREQVHFYDWDRPSAVVRWMTSWDTTTTDVDRFVTAITDASRAAPAPKRISPDDRAVWVHGCRGSRAVRFTMVAARDGNADATPASDRDPMRVGAQFSLVVDEHMDSLTQRARAA